MVPINRLTLTRYSSSLLNSAPPDTYGREAVQVWPVWQGLPTEGDSRPALKDSSGMLI